MSGRHGSALAPLIGTPEYYERLRDIEDRHWWSRGMRSVAAALLAPYLVPPADRRWRVLDSGCGTGGTLEWIRSVSGAGDSASLWGIDLSEHALAFCARRGQAHLCRASALDLPFPDEEFDLALSLDVLQHLPGPSGDARALSEIRRVLRPSGVLFVRANARGANDPDIEDEGYRRYRLEELRQRVEGAGLAVERITYVNGLSIWIDRLRPWRQERASPTHDQGLRIQRLPPHLEWANVILTWLLGLEGRYLARPGRTLARGRSTMCVARRP